MNNIFEEELFGVSFITESHDVSVVKNPRTGAVDIFVDEMRVEIDGKEGFADFDEAFSALSFLKLPYKKTNE